MLNLSYRTVYIFFPKQQRSISVISEDSPKAFCFGLYPHCWFVCVIVQSSLDEVHCLWLQWWKQNDTLHYKNILQDQQSNKAAWFTVWFREKREKHRPCFSEHWLSTNNYLNFFTGSVSPNANTLGRLRPDRAVRVGTLPRFIHCVERLLGITQRPLLSPSLEIRSLITTQHLTFNLRQTKYAKS